MTLIIMLLVPLIISLALLLFYRAESVAAEERARRQQQRADKAEYQLMRQTRLNNELLALQAAQQQETRNESTHEHLAARADFDNDWSRGARLPDAAAANTATSNTVADASGVAGD
ncbi:MAG: hypothetical protein M8364_08115 [Methylobacter sp.]|uniref:hypothetical protein n=1 Tax=Methylobacter sp. TaxID=2051955 RepID=UPI00258AD1C1|nr:hypothetical protein [Methylobacter sp.]MCL7420851.1 hypothetical protein [Methylobacter sp.]